MSKTPPSRPSLDGWSLIPGPPPWRGPPRLSIEAEMSLARYPAPRVAAAISALPGVAAPPAPAISDAFWRWRALYEDEDDLFEIGFSLFEEPDAALIWGGSDITACRSPRSLMRVWTALRHSLDRVWLHTPDGEVLRPDHFEDRFPAPIRRLGARHQTKP